MNKQKILSLIVLIVAITASNTFAQRGYFDAPYIRYEADSGNYSNATVTTRSYAQGNLQSEASGQVCLDMSNVGASVAWTLVKDADGLVVRYSIPDGDSAKVGVYANNVLVDTLTLTTYYSWEWLSVVDANIPNKNPKMRFDEVRMRMPNKVKKGEMIKLVTISGKVSVDFIELEDIQFPNIPAATDTVYSGNGSDLQTFINGCGGKTIFLPEGVYNVNRELYFGVNNTTLKGAGMWYTQIHFTNINGGKGGLRGNAKDISFSDLYLTTVRNARAGSYKAINGVYTSGSLLKNIWAEHFECGAWIGQYNQGDILYADGFKMTDCRFRNNYADGINLCKGTRNAIVEHCDFRNNGDDDMAIWSANGLECQNNTFAYSTSEHCWRASGCAIYGGLNNKAHHLLIKDNLEVGIRVNNDFPGAGFNKKGMHVFSDITIIRCGTFNDIFNGNVGAIDLACNKVAGTRINNVRFAKIDIIDSKNDAIYIYKKGGEGFYNMIFDTISVDGTGREVPNNNIKKLTWGRGYGMLVAGNPSGDGKYCNMSYKNIDGISPSNTNFTQLGPFAFIESCEPPTPTQMTSAETFGICDEKITLSATSMAIAPDSVSFMEFFLDNVSLGKDSIAPYSIELQRPELGSYQLKSNARFSNGKESSSVIQDIVGVGGMYPTSIAPVIDGVIDTTWNKFEPISIGKTSVGSFSNAADMSATFKITRDAVGFYILVDVTDDILRNDGAYDWQRDAVEIFIDMDNDKVGGYVANNDFQYTFVWNKVTPQAGVTFAQTTKTDNLGYIMEIMIPWTTMKKVPAEGTFIGFDIHVDDNDSGTRNGKKAWTDNTDNAWQSTSVLGAFQIAGCENPYIPSSVQSVSADNSKLNFYPNPFSESGTLTVISENGKSFSVSIMDLCGKVLWNEKFIGSGSYSIGENLSSGMYLIQVSDGINKQTTKMIKL